VQIFGSIGIKFRILHLFFVFAYRMMTEKVPVFQNQSF